MSGAHLETSARPATNSRNAICSCGSGKRYKHCCGASDGSGKEKPDIGFAPSTTVHIDLSAGGAYLEPDWGMRSICDWARLKFQINEQRLAVLAMPRRTPSLLRDAALRRPTGDTERLRVDVLRANFRKR